jgi:hypothetical protein
VNFFHERRQRPVKTSNCCVCQMPMSEQDHLAGEPACESCRPVYLIASSDPLTAKRTICTADAFQLQQAFDIEIGKPMPRLTILKEIHRRRMELARRNARSRQGFRVDLVNVDELDRELISSLVCVLSDPQMAETRNRLRDGFLALAVESGEVTWIDTDRVADELAARLVAAALPGRKA